MAKRNIINRSLSLAFTLSILDSSMHQTHKLFPVWAETLTTLPMSSKNRTTSNVIPHLYVLLFWRGKNAAVVLSVQRLTVSVTVNISDELLSADKWEKEDSAKLALKASCSSMASLAFRSRQWHHSSLPPPLMLLLPLSLRLGRVPGKYSK